MVISNTTPLINFAQTGLLGVLKSLYGSVSIPLAVANELHEKRDLFPEAAKVPDCEFVSVIEEPMKDSRILAELNRSLHAGEAACIALGLEFPSPRLILDDGAAREVAEFHKLRYTGTLGCLLEAKNRKLITELKPVIHDLRNKARFWINQELESRVLTLAKEHS